jgi:hypothetical protein
MMTPSSGVSLVMAYAIGCVASAVIARSRAAIMSACT